MYRLGNCLLKYKKLQFFSGRAVGALANGIDVERFLFGSHLFVVSMDEYS
jgi:hypothetical protein